MSTGEVLGWCLLYFKHQDEANAVMHTAAVRYSPITFRLAECIDERAHGDPNVEPSVLAVARMVLGDKGQYEEDKGR